MNYLRLILVFILPFLGIAQEFNSPTNTFIADSLDSIGEYEESLKYRELALKEKDHTTDYKTYLKAK